MNNLLCIEAAGEWESAAIFSKHFVGADMVCRAVMSTGIMHVHEGEEERVESRAERKGEERAKQG